MRDYIIARAIDHGWQPHASTWGAQTVAYHLLEARPGITKEEVDLFFDFFDIEAEFIPDPHDWNYIGSGLALVDWQVRQIG